MKASDLNWPAVVMFGCGSISVTGFTLGVLKIAGIVKVPWYIPIGLWIVVPVTVMGIAFGYEIKKGE